MPIRKNDKAQTGLSAFVQSLPDEFVNPEVSEWDDLWTYLDRLERLVVESGVSTAERAPDVTLEVMERLGIPLELWFRTLLPVC